MALNPEETVIAGNGDVYVAAVGTALPADPSVAPAAGWTHLGYITDDGVTFTPDQNVEEYTAWQSLLAIRRARTSLSFTAAFTCVQVNADTLRLAFGGGDITPAGAGEDYDTYEPPEPGDMYEQAVLLRANDGTRIYDIGLKRAIPSDLGDMQWAKGSMTGLTITLGILAPDDASKPFQIMYPKAAAA